MSKINHSLFTAREHALQQAYGVCPDCAGQLTLKHAKHGTFIGCSGYPQCHYSKPLHETETTEIKRIDGAYCPQCSQPLAIKKGRYGLFIGCSNFPQCHHIEPIKKQSATACQCPACKSGALVKRTNKFGKAFYACDQYPACKYVLNATPVDQSCPLCGWTLLITKTTAKGNAIACPQRSCTYQQLQGKGTTDNLPTK